MRDRGSCILIKDKKIALIKRIRDQRLYYVFPGGGIEIGETPEEATIREAYEELGVKIALKDCLQILQYNGGTQYFFTADIIEGSFGTGRGEEYFDQSRNRGTYEPVWVNIDELPLLNVVPNEVAIRINRLFS